MCSGRANLGGPDQVFLRFRLGSLDALLRMDEFRLFEGHGKAQPCVVTSKVSLPSERVQGGRGGRGRSRTVTSSGLSKLGNPATSTDS